MLKTSWKPGGHEILPFVVVGHSLGGAVAMELAKTYPDRINKLVLVILPNYKA